MWRVLPGASAAGMSLAIMGGTSVAGRAWRKHRQGLVHWRAAALFGGAGMVGSLAGAQFTRLVSPGVFVLIFAALMAVVAWRMLAHGGDETSEPLPDCRPLRCGAAGLVVGLFTGFVGVGSGFLIVPAMILFCMAISGNRWKAAPAASQKCQNETLTPFQDSVFIHDPKRE